MAKIARSLSGSGQFLRKYKINATIATAGVPILVGASATAGVQPMLTQTLMARTLGINLDTGTYTTTQSASMVEGVVTTVINPDSVWAWLLSGSTAGTSGTILSLTTNLTASSGGTTHTITTGDQVPNSPTMLDGTLLYISGNNTGLTRRITSVTATTAVVTVPFPNAIAVGDTAVMLPYNMDGPTAVLGGAIASQNVSTDTSGTPTVDVTGLNATVAITTNLGFHRPVDLIYDFQGISGGRATAQLLSIPYDHVFGLGR